MFSSWRSFHNSLSLFAFIPLLITLTTVFITIITGLLYAILSYWFGYTKENTDNKIKILLYLHEGAYLGNPAIYVGIIAIIFFIIIFTGLVMQKDINQYLCNRNNNNTN